MYGGLILIAAGLTLATGNETRLVMALLTALVLDKKVSAGGGGAAASAELALGSTGARPEMPRMPF